MSSLKISAPKVSTRSSNTGIVPKGPKNTGIVPQGPKNTGIVPQGPKNTGIVPQGPKNSRPVDGFEKAGHKQPGRRRDGSSFEPAGPHGSRPSKTPGSGGNKISQEAFFKEAESKLGKSLFDTLKKAGEDLAAKLGAGAKNSDIKNGAKEIVKGLDLGLDKHLFRLAKRVVAMSARYASGSGGSKDKTFGAD